MLAQKKLDDHKRQALAALGPTRKAIEKVRLATPETFEALKKEVEDLLTAELAKLAPETANALFEEAEQHMEFARMRVEQIKEQQRLLQVRKDEAERRQKIVDEDNADPTAPPRIAVPMGSIGQLIGKGGGTLKRLIMETGCKIDVEQQILTADGLVPITLGGVAKQRRLAAEAIELIVDGAAPEDVSARIKGGALIVPHGLKHAGREEWLGWRLKAIEVQHGVKGKLNKSSVRFDDMGGGTLAEDSAERAALRDAVVTAVDEAHGLVEEVVEAKEEHKPTDELLAELLSPLCQRYGVLAKALPAEEELVTIGMLGPQDAARDAAALVWSRFVQGRSVATVLQHPGRVQAMSAVMAKDFDNDVRAFEEECEGLQVSQSKLLFWIEGPSDDVVKEGRETICEMLQFYLASDFFMLEGVKKDGLDKLKNDPEILALTSVETAALAVYAAEGAVWLCGSPESRGPLEKRVRALVGMAKTA